MSSPKRVLSSRPTLPLRWHLVLLVAGTLLPVLCFTAAVVFQLSQEAKNSSKRRLDHAAQTLAAAMDREILATIHTLEVIAQSHHLDTGNLRAFHAEAKRALGTQPLWWTIILLTPDGQQVVNANAPFGRPLPGVIEPQSLQRLLRTRRPVVGNLKRGKLTNKLGFPIRVPVIRNGRIVYVLTAVMTTDSLAAVLRSLAATEGEWTRGLIDSNGVIAARSRTPEKFVGTQARASFLQLAKRQRSGLIQTTTREGLQVYSSFRRLDTADWTASVSIPVRVIEAPLRDALTILFSLGAILLLLSALGALIFSRRIARPIASAASAAQALAKGETPHVEHAGIEEVAALAVALQSSSQLLQQHEREQEQHLARVEIAREEAESANRLKDHFLAALSHELRTPLTAILGWVSLLRRGSLDEANVAQSVETIERNSRSLAALVDDLLDMSSITTNKVRLDVQEVNLAEVVTSAADSMRPAMQDKKIDLQLEIGATPTVNGDPFRLQQVMMNLLSNAVKFTPEGGQVDVSLGEDEEHASIQIHDSGIGIDPAFAPFLFEKFRQAEGGSKRRFGGLGLGLALVRSLVELHGGTVDAHSDGKDKGATFYVKLPKVKYAASATEGIHIAPVTQAMDSSPESE